MKKNILLLTTLLFFLAADAEAQEKCAQKTDCYWLNEMNYYGRILAGANFLQNTSLNQNEPKYDAGYIIEGSLGFYSCYGLRVEGEYSYRRNAINKIQFPGQGSSNHGHFQTSSFMANLLWDFPLSSWGCTLWNTRPFVGAGIGYDFQHMHASSCRINFRQNWDHFAWQLMAGFAYEIFCHTELSLEYKFHQGGSQFNNHSLGLGLIYQFGFSR